MRVAGWNDPDPAEVHHPTTAGEWDAALSRYLGSLNDIPLQRCVEVARSLGAQTLVVETRYLDIDYRSEFSAYYSRQFADVPRLNSPPPLLRQAPYFTLAVAPSTNVGVPRLCRRAARGNRARITRAPPPTS
jgi:hypothetical protein